MVETAWIYRVMPIFYILSCYWILFVFKCVSFSLKYV
jgi:hypothetical protein